MKMGFFESIERKRSRMERVLSEMVKAESTKEVEKAEPTPEPQMTTEMITPPQPLDLPLQITHNEIELPEEVKIQEGPLKRKPLDTNNLPVFKNNFKQKARLRFNKVVLDRLPFQNTFTRKRKKQMTIISRFTVVIIRVSALSVGAFAIILSVHYNITEAVHYLDPVFAVVFSLMTVLFTCTAFETAILFALMNIHWIKKCLIVSFFSLLFVAGIVISMSSVVAGRYSKYIENQLTKTKEISGLSSDKFRWEEIQKTKTRLEQRIAAKQNQINQLHNISSTVKDVDVLEQKSKGFDYAQKRMDVIEQELGKLYTELAAVQSKEQMSLDKSPELASATISLSGIATDFHGWLHNVTGWAKDKIAFWLALIPAFLIDILGPVSMAVAIFLRKID